MSQESDENKEVYGHLCLTLTNENVIVIDDRIYIFLNVKNKIERAKLAIAAPKSISVRHERKPL